MKTEHFHSRSKERHKNLSKQNETIPFTPVNTESIHVVLEQNLNYAAENTYQIHLYIFRIWNPSQLWTTSNQKLSAWVDQKTRPPAAFHWPGLLMAKPYLLVTRTISSEYGRLRKCNYYKLREYEKNIWKIYKNPTVWSSFILFVSFGLEAFWSKSLYLGEAVRKKWIEQQ